MLAHLADVFTHMNDLNVFLQGKEMNILKCCKNFNAFEENLSLCCQWVERANISNL